MVVQFKNDEQTAKGLGIPLPKGPVRVFQTDGDGELELAGMDALDHTPKDETLNIRLGYAFDIVGQRLQFAQRNGFNFREEDHEIRLRNHKKDTVTVDVVESIDGASLNWTILKQSHTFTQRDVNTLVCPVEIKPNSDVVLTYTIRYMW